MSYLFQVKTINLPQSTNVDHYPTEAMCKTINHHGSVLIFLFVSFFFHFMLWRVVAESVSVPRFTKHSWIAFSALRGAYKHVQVIVIKLALSKQASLKKICNTFYKMEQNQCNQTIHCITVQHTAYHLRNFVLGFASN